MPSPLDFEDGARVFRDAAPEPTRLKKPTSFGSPGGDTTVRGLDLHEALVQNPQATYLFRAKGSAMAGAGIGNDDILVVDRPLTPIDESIVIAVVEGDLVCRRLRRKGAKVKLVTVPSSAADFTPGQGEALEIWGVVSYVIKSVLA